MKDLTKKLNHHNIFSISKLFKIVEEEIATLLEKCEATRSIFELNLKIHVFDLKTPNASDLTKNLYMESSSPQKKVNNQYQ